MFIVYNLADYGLGIHILRGKCKAISSVRKLNTMPMRVYVKGEGIVRWSASCFDCFNSGKLSAFPHKYAAE